MRPSASARSVKQPTRVELLVGLEIAFSPRCQSRNISPANAKGAQTICRDNTSIPHRRRRPIEFFPTILVDMLPDEVLAVARMQTIVEQPTASKGRRRGLQRRVVSDREPPIVRHVFRL